MRMHTCTAGCSSEQRQRSVIRKLSRPQDTVDLRRFDALRVARNLGCGIDKVQDNSAIAGE